MNHWPLLVILQFCLVTLISGQEIDRSVLASAGKQDTIKLMTIDWTLGESFVASSQSKDYLYTEGFHQPQLRVDVFHGKLADPNLTISIFPNPVQDLLSIHSSASEIYKLHITLYDISGKNLMLASTMKSSGHLELDMSSYASGIYIVSIHNEEGVFVNSYKISKAK